MLSIGMFNLLALRAAATLEKRVWTRPMQLAIAGCVFGMTLYLWQIWVGGADDDSPRPQSSSPPAGR